MAANYSLSSATGQACAWRVMPHFRKGWRRIGGSEKGKNVNPPHEKVLTHCPAPLLLSNEMVLSGVTKGCYRGCVCISTICVHW